MNSGAHGKFLSRLDLDVAGGRVRAHRYKLVPVLSNYVAEDAEMARLIREIRAPWAARLDERLAVSESLLYRRGNFNGSFDEIVLDALLKQSDAEVAFSPGFRWGVTIVPGQVITLEDVYAHTGITYPNTLTRELTGAEIHRIMEDVADNLRSRARGFPSSRCTRRRCAPWGRHDPSSARGGSSPPARRAHTSA